MAVKIAHAVVNDKGTTKGGLIGDQNQEVRFAKWYARNSNGAVWAHRIRPRNPEMANAAASMAEDVVENQGIGYGQEADLRLTLYTEAMRNGGSFKGITATCDCSSMILAIFAILIPGFPYKGSTATMASQFAQFQQYFEISKDEAVLGSDATAKRGDIYLRPGHVLIVLSDGPMAEHTSAPVATTTAMPSSGKRIIMDSITKWCNVRSGPGTENPKIGIAKVNEVFTLLGVDEEWYHIDFHGKDGWVYYAFASEMLEGNV